ncbi:acyltransferase [Phytohalomonas tamaricis]|uniref:acyltransferase n=1 Tax=Phytohalomonas tamaricis TaxID=2081032 RepID=UPI002948BE11|nr:acyltransferase [Phytohalomonas tamaricis]
MLLVLNTLFWCVPLYILAIIKLLMPTHRLRLGVLKGLNRIALAWIATNNWWIRHWLKPRFDIHLPDDLSPDAWWLILVNHRSWTDIFILQFALYGHTPMPRFFLKRQLIWIPVIGFAWWALEFPFMRRYSREHLARDPGLAQRDLETTRRMCESAQELPMAIYNFAEGTRFTSAKHSAQQSPYNHLLKPKAGGSAQVIHLLGARLAGIIDITLDYRQSSTSFWAFLCGRSDDISLYARRLDIPDWMIGGDYSSDMMYKERFQAWLNALWHDKDRLLSRCSG